jgi:hypothetical protein
LEPPNKKAPNFGAFCFWLLRKAKSPRFKASPRDDSFIVVVTAVLLGVVPEIGIEPTTYALRMRRSTN